MSPFKLSWIYIVRGIMKGANWNNAVDNYIISNINKLAYYILILTNINVVNSGRNISLSRKYLRLKVSNNITEALPGATYVCMCLYYASRGTN
jgi:hypothetical protein